MPSANELRELARRAIEAFERLSPEEQNEHRRQQYVSWVRGNLRLSEREVDEEELFRTVDRLQAEGRIDYRENKLSPKAALERLLEDDIGAFHLYTNDVDTVSARSLEDAIEVWCEVYNLPQKEANLSQLPDDQVLTLTSKRWPDGQKTQTHAEWAEEIGRGHVCCIDGEPDE